MEAFAALALGQRLTDPWTNPAREREILGSRTIRQLKYPPCSMSPVRIEDGAPAGIESRLPESPSARL